ncbi:MAG: CPBP family intramembrane glutamic endopeptidase, partial [Anaerolineales bacterium]
ILEKSRTSSLGKPISAAFFQASLFLFLLICGLAVFVLGTSYYDQFPTNTSGLFKIGLSALYLLTAILSRKIDLLRPYWRLMYAFFAASMVNGVAWYFAIYLREGLFEVLQVSTATTPGMTFAKLLEASLTVGTILVLVKLSGDDLPSLFIRKGKLRWSLRIGVLALVNFTAAGILLAVNRDFDIKAMIPDLPWWLVFSLANGFMEELWFRGLFLGRLQELVGAGGALWMTSIWFGVMHVFAVYVSGIGALVFMALTFTLGFAFALVMQKTKNIWGATLFHATADFHWLIALGF